MRKKLAVLIAVITAAMMLFGCGGKDMSGSEYLGKWKATKAEYAGIEVGVDTVFDEFHFTLQDNGKVKLNVNGDETTGKWDETEDFKSYQFYYSAHSSSYVWGSMWCDV